ncbi:SWIM zinc finger family protein [Actinokineospora guangxiensis]|uniref:SWIM zinc finger family protein n=1 Tax=Actinokineospora guangxiensis TaxID=1490288 RepID=A0ABW0EQ50_9PSEU
MSRARGFPAFGPVRGAGRFARTWWGRAWVAGLEDSALDGEQLRVGRKLARAGHVGAITASPGRLSAVVHDPGDDAAYPTAVRVPELTDAEWDRLAAQVGAESGHLAALLDGEMPTALADAASAVDVALLPGIGDFDSDCGCPGWEMPCRHAAAVAYQAAWLLDADPFVLLLLRGRDRDFLVETAPPGIPATAAFADPVATLPAPPGVPADRPAALSVPAAPGIDPDALALLAADAAVRARALLAECSAPGEVAVLPLADDIVRFAAVHPTAEPRLRGARADLDRAVAAWRQGGLAGLRALDTVWKAPRAELARGGDAAGSVAEAAVEVTGNHVTLGDAQLRYGRDGRWYPYRRRANNWWPSGRPNPDAAAALLDAGGVVEGG